MNHLVLRNIHKKFNQVTALDDVNIEVPKGELIALLGPSGSGKSTLLRILAGLDQPSQGEILIDGKNILHVPTEKRNIGLVFQSYSLFPHMTVEKNIMFGLQARGLEKDDIHRIVSEILETIQLEGMASRFPHQLSGGQTQRIAIARTLVTNPDVLLLDEPLASLDTKLRNEMRQFILRLHRKTKITTVLVTHDQVEAMEMADRIAVLHQGKLIQVDAPQKVFNCPQDEFVASFMGAENILTGNMQHQGNRWWLQCEIGSVPVHNIHDHAEGKLVKATVRPERITLAQKKSGEGDIFEFECRVNNWVYSGSTQTTEIQAGQKTLSVMSLSGQMRDNPQTMTAVIRAEDIWIFP